MKVRFWDNLSLENIKYTISGNLTVEKWKDVPGYEGLYMASDLGRIKSLPKNNNSYRTLILKQVKIKAGYLVVMLCKDKKSKYTKVHRIICETFNPNPYNKPQVNHIDGDKTNNEVKNLEWCTPKENTHHAVISNLKPYGERSNLSKLKTEDVMDIFKSKEKVVFIAKKYNLTRRSVYNIKQKKSWKHLFINY